MEGPMASHGARHAEFARWVVDTFGENALSSGTGILDVAGGRGALSFELQCKLQIPCTLLEPREVSLMSGQRRHLRKQRQGKTPGSGEVYAHVQQRLDEAFEATEEGKALLSSSSVLVGLHSDEATEPLVRAALRHGKPFAVVPCCVFASLHPWRKLADGRGVGTYEALCEYLMELAGAGCESAYLPFDGRNRVIYMRSARASAAAAAPAESETVSESVCVVCT